MELEILILTKLKSESEPFEELITWRVSGSIGD